MKIYWTVTLGFNIAGAAIMFAKYVRPTGSGVDLAWLIINLLGTYVSYRMVQAIASIDREK